MERRLENLEHAVWGNGQKGLKEKVIKLETKLKDMEEHAKEIAIISQESKDHIIAQNAVQKMRARTTNVLLIVFGLIISGISIYDKLL
jgi:HSP90 family molecular chaperone